jgi:glycosyltransferase involved in cell wall biosynthesis
VFVGTMNWYPNIDAALFFLKEVWPLLKEKIPTLTMDIAGTNPPESVVTLGKSLPGVTVHGYVDDVRPMIDSAAVFVCPIRDGGGTKLKILDAFAMKKCVVAHPIACEGINATPGKDIVFASTPAEFVAEIERLLADEPARRALGAAARDLVEREYSFRAIGKEFSQVIEGVVARHRQPA